MHDVFVTPISAENAPASQYSGTDSFTPPAIVPAAAESTARPAVPTSPVDVSYTVPNGTWSPEYGYESLPPSPPSDDGTPPPVGPRWPRRRRWLSGVLAGALLAVLGVGTSVAIANARSASTHTIVLGAASAPALTVSSSTTSIQQSVENVAKTVEPSVVKITSIGTGREAVGSGDILTANGYIVTNDHVVAGFSNYTVTLSNGKTYAATLVGQDAQDDLAVVKIDATNLQPIAFANSSTVTVGEFAVAVGNPLALQESATLGTVSAVNGTASEAPSGPASELTGLVQTTATINPGNSGGALVNLQGQLIGIPTLEVTNTETNSASGLGYAISSSRVQYVATQLIQNGHLASTGQGFLGIQAQDVTPQTAAADGLSVQSGVLVNAFANDAAGQSPARQAGLQTGDVITAVNGQTIASQDDLASALLNQSPNTKVTLTVIRGSSQSSVTVTLGERPTSTQG